MAAAELTQLCPTWPFICSKLVQSYSYDEGRGQKGRKPKCARLLEVSLRTGTLLDLLLSIDQSRLQGQPSSRSRETDSTS